MRSQLVVVLLLAGILAGCGANSGPRSLQNSLGSQDSNLSAQTANNSSAADSFQMQRNGNLGANNVSKVNVHSLLYEGAQTKVFAHLLLWFGSSNHMNVGYNSNDAKQVQRQITDMISRGIDGVIVDWYGPNNSIDQATQLVMREAEKHQGFSFAIMVDAGAMGSGACSGCSSEQTLVKLLQYVAKTYFPSKAYLNIGGEPVVTDFNVDPSHAINWDQVRSAISSAPRFLFQNNDGFTHQTSDGSYSWVMPQFGNYGLSYLEGFYDTGIAFADKETVGAVYKGFNDSLAGWGSGRVMNQQCGQTWLQTFSRVNSVYNSGRQLPYLQLVTWNDYEEGTEIESGIDSCLSVSTSIAANKLLWKVSGNENTVDHYSVFSSKDGKNLTKLADAGAGVHSADLCSLAVPPGTYKLYVQAVGKPMLTNRMPGPVDYSPSCQ